MDRSDAGSRSPSAAQKRKQRKRCVCRVLLDTRASACQWLPTMFDLFVFFAAMLIEER